MIPSLREKDGVPGRTFATRKFGPRKKFLGVGMVFSKNQNGGFTLAELLISIAILGSVATIVSSLFIQSFRESKKANTWNQIYEDARFIMERIAQEIREGTIDYDEYYSQKVVPGTTNFGQNYGRYFSSFFHPGSDIGGPKLGFNCNKPADGRNNRECIPIRKTIDRHTGMNPFSGKYADNALNAADQEDAFCGLNSYNTLIPDPPPGKTGECANPADKNIENELYLIDASGREKTILARERIGGTVASPIYALSLLRLTGLDANGDNVSDSFECKDGFECIICPGGIPTAAVNPKLPRSRDEELKNVNNDLCDSAALGFSKDFVPISPFRVNVKDLNFIIEPKENPHYAFAETENLKQPLVTIVLTIEQNQEKAGILEPFQKITLVETVYTGVLSPIPAPLLVE